MTASPPQANGHGPPPDAPARPSARSPIAPLRPGQCPRCGIPYAPGQEYCLECGLRLPLRRGFGGRLETAWRRRVPWYPGDWVWPALLMLVIAAAGATLAALYADRAETAPATIVATTTPGVTTAQATTATVPAQTTTQPAPATETAPTTEPAPPAPPPARSATIIEWPAGQVGYTIVLRSIPVERGLAQARAEARRALDAGVGDVGILESSDYASLHPRYYVVFSGVFETRDEADGALPQVHANGFPEAYAREVAP